jgi:predicted HTH transcriptional regulator
LLSFTFFYNEKEKERERRRKERVVANRENVDVEYKRIYVQELRKDIIAFANAERGTFYIGINDDGSKRIKALYKNSEKQSVFESAQGAFKTTLFNLNIDEQSEKVISYQPETEKEIVMGLVKRQGSIVSRNYQSIFNISEDV